MKSAFILFNGDNHKKWNFKKWEEYSYIPKKPEIYLGVFPVFMLDFSVWNLKLAKFEVG